MRNKSFAIDVHAAVPSNVDILNVELFSRFTFRFSYCKLFICCCSSFMMVDNAVKTPVKMPSKVAAFKVYLHIAVFCSQNAVVFIWFNFRLWLLFLLHNSLIRLHFHLVSVWHSFIATIIQWKWWIEIATFVSLQVLDLPWLTFRSLHTTSILFPLEKSLFIHSTLFLFLYLSVLSNTISFILSSTISWIIAEGFFN